MSIVGIRGTHVAAIVTSIAVMTALGGVTAYDLRAQMDGGGASPGGGGGSIGQPPPGGGGGGQGPGGGGGGFGGGEHRGPGGGGGGGFGGGQGGSGIGGQPFDRTQGGGGQGRQGGQGGGDMRGGAGGGGGEMRGGPGEGGSGIGGQPFDRAQGGGGQGRQGRQGGQGGGDMRGGAGGGGEMRGGSGEGGQGGFEIRGSGHGSFETGGRSGGGGDGGNFGEWDEGDWDEGEWDEGEWDEGEFDDFDEDEWDEGEWNEGDQGRWGEHEGSPWGDSDFEGHDRGRFGEDEGGVCDYAREDGSESGQPLEQGGGCEYLGLPTTGVFYGEGDSDFVDVCAEEPHECARTLYSQYFEGHDRGRFGEDERGEWGQPFDGAQDRGGPWGPFDGAQDRGGPGGPHGGFDPTREIKNLQREGKNIVRELKNLERMEADTSELESLAADFESAVNEAASLAEAGAEDEDSQWALEDAIMTARDAQMAFWDAHRDTMDSVWETQVCRDAERAISDMTRGMKQHTRGLVENVGRGNPDAASAIEEILAEADAEIANAEDMIASGNPEDCEEAMWTADEIGFGIRDQIESFMEESGGFMEPGMGGGMMGFGFEDRYSDFMDEEFSDSNFDKDAMVEVFSKQGYGNSAMALMQQMAKAMMEEFLGRMAERGGVGGTDLITYATETGLDTDTVQDLISVKNDLLAEIDALREQVSSLKGELATILNEVESYNFGEKTGKKAKQFLAELEDLDPEQARDRVEDLKEEAREEKLSIGAIGFLDADDNTWYGDDALRAKKLGLVKGVDKAGTKLDAARETNVAEAITMFARVHGVDPNARPDSEVGRSLPSWAQAAAGSLEEQGVDLDEIFAGKDAGDSAERGEVAQLLVEVLDLPPVDVSEAEHFRDIDEASYDEARAIATVKEAHIMTGYGADSAKAGEFGVEDPLDRAALVKVLVGATEEAERENIQEEQRSERRAAAPTIQFDEDEIHLRQGKPSRSDIQNSAIQGE